MAKFHEQPLPNGVGGKYAALAKIAQSALTSADFKSILGIALAITKDVLAADLGLVADVNLSAIVTDVVALGHSSARPPAGILSDPAGRSLLLCVLDSAGPVRFSEISKDNPFVLSDALKNADVKSGLLVQLRSVGTCDSVLGLFSTRTRHFLTEDEDFLQSVAVILAAARERREIVEHLGQKAKEQASVAKLSVTALASQDFNAILRSTAEIARQVLQVELAEIAVVDSNVGVVRTIAATEAGVGSVVRRKLSDYPKTSMLHFVLDSKQPARVSDIDKETRFTLTTLRAQGIRSALVVPAPALDGTGACIGTFSTRVREFSDDEVDFLLTFASILEMARDRETMLAHLLLRDRALEGISQGVTIADIRAPGFPVIYTNPAFAALTRYTANDVVGRSAVSFCEPSLVPRYEENLSRALVDKRPFRVEAHVIRKDGTAFTNNAVSTMILDQDGIVTHLVTIHEDVTEVRRREELLLEAQKMESVGQLTGGIAHDFNNLLTAIKSNAEDLREDLKETPILQSQAEIILEAADRGAGLVAQLMAFARKQELQPKVVDVNALLDEFGKLLRSTVPAHIDIEMRKAEKLPAVYVDPGRLETAILNLAINARDAMPDGGTITIETSLRTLDADYVTEHIDVQRGDYVLIAVTDTGIGMAPEIAERAFVPFFTTKEIGKGAGLGLSMVYGFVKQSGGRAIIYSEKGLGTVVKVYLPVLNQAAPSGDRPTAVDKAKPGTGSILLVEDDSIVRQSISGNLTRLGYQVVTAGNAPEAIETLKSNPHFDLVFSDVIMPGSMNGAELVREVRRRWPQINVLLTSGYTETTVLAKVNLPTDVGLLSKPYSTKELVAAIRKACERVALS